MSGIPVFIATLGANETPLLTDHEGDREFWWLYWWANAAVIVAFAGLAYHVWASNPVEKRECIRGHWEQSHGKSKGRYFACDHWRVTLKDPR